MTTQDMTDLFIINDAAEAISSVFGEIGEEGRFGELQRAVFRLISRNAPIYDPEKDIDDQEIGEILDQREDYEERDGRLLRE